MQVNDLITGKDRSFERSIYRIRSLEPFKVSFVSYNGFLSEEDDSFEHRYPTSLIITPLGNSCTIVPAGIVTSKLEDFRLATPEEVELSRTKKI